MCLIILQKKNLNTQNYSHIREKKEEINYCDLTTNYVKKNYEEDKIKGIKSVELFNDLKIIYPQINVNIMSSILTTKCLVEKKRKKEGCYYMIQKRKEI